MIKLPIICSNKYGKSKQTPFTVFNGWTRPEFESYSDDELSDSDDSSDANEKHIDHIVNKIYNLLLPEIDICDSDCTEDKPNNYITPIPELIWNNLIKFYCCNI